MINVNQFQKIRNAECRMRNFYFSVFDKKNTLITLRSEFYPKKMTNRSTCRRHGGHEINERRKKSTLAKRDNKGKARKRREKLREAGLNC